MTVTTQPSHDADDAPRARSRGRAVSIVVASLGTLAIVVALLLTSRAPSTLEVHSIPAQSDTSSARLAAPVAPAPAPQSSPVAPVAPAAPAAPADAPATMPMDSQGFVDSAARCDSDQRAVAVARTERAAVAVCREGNRYLYRGVRLRDGASLRLDDVRLIPAGFEARNDTTTYRLTDTELVVIEGEALQSRDRVVEYRAG
ncbi:hypothetical protein [Mycobacterium sp. PSTR-4-N]|uniref:hypothetical protein n=1 Tax=Mycobacterium sp. PSTR-4-N TaxID=2917745 RepID=UPI001F14ECBF|nr:hypothetical protein [Mycobacterium sp. PSTR-4-N]MCG7597088.1 hypothetical protein [Mycobacterium sp. PSTR-4-N]